MTNLEDRLVATRQRICEAERAAGRKADSTRLIAVSKMQQTSALREAYRCGQRDFGENYLQEALLKQQELALQDVVWHFIGPIQTNKTKLIAQHFDWVHSVDRLKVAERLSAQRPNVLPPLNILLQVNVSGEPSKSGVSVSDLPDLAKGVAKLPDIRLRGLMAIPAPTRDFAEQRSACRTLRLALEGLNIEEGELSMGMSDDLEAAIMEGATMVRIGTAIFGAR